MRVKYVALDMPNSAGREFEADVNEYEPGFADGYDVRDGFFVVLKWDGDEWVEVDEEDAY